MCPSEKKKLSFSYFFFIFFVSIFYYLPYIFFILSIYETQDHKIVIVTSQLAQAHYIPIFA